MRVTDLDCKSNHSNDTAHKVLAQLERAKKKRKYLEVCNDQFHTFHGFHGWWCDPQRDMSLAVPAPLDLLADKWDQPYSIVCGYINHAET
jgi:hypothetical protein